eukprot:Skav223501  [mRNA]  locus=scaffold1160:97047:101038:- [translate_table: standard]
MSASDFAMSRSKSLRLRLAGGWPVRGALSFVAPSWRRQRQYPQSRAAQEYTMTAETRNFMHGQLANCTNWVCSAVLHGAICSESNL